LLHSRAPEKRGNAAQKLGAFGKEALSAIPALQGRKNDTKDKLQIMIPVSRQSYKSDKGSFGITMMDGGEATTVGKEASKAIGLILDDTLTRLFQEAVAIPVSQREVPK